MKVNVVKGKYTIVMDNNTSDLKALCYGEE